MNIFGKRLSDYARFARLFITLVAAAGLTRLALTLSGSPNSTARWFSMTALMWIAVVYYAIRIRATDFGTYKHLLPVLALPNLVAQGIAITGILIAIFSGTPNIFSAPEYAFGGDGRTWSHVAAHLFFGTTVGSLVPWAVGCAIMVVAKRRSQVSDPKIKSLA